MRVPICEWCPKFQLLPLGRAIHNGAQLFLCFQMNFLVGNPRQHSHHHHASQATIGSVARSPHSLFPPGSEKLGLSIWKNWVYSLRKNWLLSEQMGINARKAAPQQDFCRVSYNFQKFRPKNFSLWEFSSCPLFATTLALLAALFHTGNSFLLCV